MSDVWDPIEPTPQPLFRIRPKWQIMKGMGFGFREPVILGAVRVAVPGDLNFEALDAAMGRFVTETVPERLPGDIDTATKLVARAMFWAIALQRQAQIPVFGSAHIGAPRKGERGDGMRLVVPYFAPQAAIAAIGWVGGAIHSYLTEGRLFTGPAEQARQQWNALGAALQKFRPGGINPYRLLSAAHELGIPAQQFMPGVFSFGIGARSRWLQSTYTDRTPLLASRFAGNKFITGRLLRNAGLPAPTHALVKSAEEAIKVAHELGYPVVVKPADRQQGNGVAANLTNDAAVLAAYQGALKFSKNILVEKHFDGIDHRMTVLNGKLMRISARLPGGVIGDGTHTVAELVGIRKGQESSIRRARERGRELLDLDAEALGLLADKNLGPDYVPKEEEYIRLRRRGNASAGATSRPVDLADAHPDNRRLAERAVAVLKLDLAGVDIIFPDITKSWMEAGAHICEVNGQPQIGRKATPDLLLALLENRGRIPVVVVVGSAPDLDWERIRKALPTRTGLGLATSSGAWLDGERLIGKPSSAFDAGLIIVNNPQAEAAVIVMGPGEIGRTGLPVDHCDVLILDAPDRWPEDKRAAVGEILDLAAPNADRRILVHPAHAVTALATMNLETVAAGAEALQETCAEALHQLLTAASSKAIDGATNPGPRDDMRSRPEVASPIAK